MADEKNVRHRFTVPSADTVVNDWIENQSNLGFSLRVLIKAFVRQYGNKDATCVEFGEAVAKRGRPRNQDIIKLGQMMSVDDYDDDDISQSDDYVQVVEPIRQVEPVKSTPVEPVVQQTEKQHVAPQPTQFSNENQSSDIMRMFSAGETLVKKNKGEKPVVSNTESQSSIMSVNEDGFVDVD